MTSAPDSMPTSTYRAAALADARADVARAHRRDLALAGLLHAVGAFLIGSVFYMATSASAAAGPVVVSELPAKAKVVTVATVEAPAPKPVVAVKAIEQKPVVLAKAPVKVVAPKPNLEELKKKCIGVPYCPFQ